MTGPRTVLDIRGLSIAISTDGGVGRLMDDVSLQVNAGEIVGLVGESGCGKSTLVNAVLGVLPGNARVTGGRIEHNGENLLDLSEQELARRIRGRSLGYIPQDPFLSLNPLFRVGTQLLEIMRWHAPQGGAAFRRRHKQQLVETLAAVQIPDPERALLKYPHEFSGGQRQRLMIAGALVCRPLMIVADEPTSALDVTTQRQILALLRDLARRSGTAVLLVTHDFGIVAEFCDSVAVMYAGQLIESGPTAEVLAAPEHPYTRALIDCHPDRGGALTGIPGLVPPVAAMPAGCRFNPRCPRAEPVCARERPAATVHGPRLVHCHLYGSKPAEMLLVGE